MTDRLGDRISASPDNQTALVEGTAVKGERSESRSDAEGALDGRDGDQTIQLGGGRDPTTNEPGGLRRGRMMEQLLTVAEAAAVLGTSSRFPRRLIC